MANRFRIAAIAGAAGLILAACTSSPSGPSIVGLAGSWSGPGSNALGQHTVSLTIVQNGASLSGTVATKALDPNDGTCSSCHMNKVGTFTGTVSGTTVSIDMTFPSGNASEPTPICSATMLLTAAGVTDARIAGTY